MQTELERMMHSFKHVKWSILLITTATVLLPLTSLAGLGNDIVISASRVAIAKVASGNSVSVLDANFLKQHQIRTVSDALRFVPSLAVHRSGGLGTMVEVRIRGAEANQTLVLIDGIEVNDVASGSTFDFTRLLNLNIERIEVLRGAQSALWGSDAMGGVVNIITKIGNGPTQINVNLEAGSFGTHQETLRISGGSEQYSYTLASTLINTDGISAASAGREDDGYENITVNFKGNLQATENITLGIVTRRTKDKVERDAEGRDNSATTDAEQNFNRIHVSWDTQGNWHHKASVSDAETQRVAIDPTYSSKNIGYKRKYVYQASYFITDVSNDQHLTLALEKEKERHDTSSNTTNASSRRINTNSAIAEYGINFDDKYYVNLATRYDNNSMFKDTMTHHINASGWFNEAVRLHTSMGNGIKNPTMTELFGYSLSYTGNTNLQPEENFTWDLGAEYSFAHLDGYIDTTVFHSRIDNLIYSAGSSATNLTATAQVQGIELSLAVNPNDILQLTGSYTYTDTNDSTGQELLRRPRHMGSLNAVYRYSDHTSITSGINYHGTRDDKDYSLPTGGYSGTRVTLPSYMLMNMAANYQYSNQIELFGRIENVLNTQYEEIVNYGTKGRSGMVGIRFSSMP
jgi:vitamin B12 transporter